jgi:hypothetical protein
MKRKGLYLEIAALMTAAIFLFTGCSAGSDSGLDADSNEDQTASLVSSVTVTPASATVTRGSTTQFTAEVEVTEESTAKTITWTVEGASKKDGTTIDANGKLTVAADEAKDSTLTVKATSTVDTSKSGTATVTVSGGGSLAISIGFADHDITVSGGTADNQISKTGAGGKPTTLTLSATGYTTPMWYVDGSAMGIGMASITLDASSPGSEVRQHSVTFTGIRDGVLYSKEIRYTVID